MSYITRTGNLAGTPELREGERGPYTYARVPFGFQLADLLGVSRQTVNALEKGRYDPSLPLAFRLARVFSTTIEDLFTPSDDDRRSTAPRPRHDSPRRPRPASGRDSRRT